MIPVFAPLAGVMMCFYFAWKAIRFVFFRPPEKTPEERVAEANEAAARNRATR